MSGSVNPAQVVSVALLKGCLAGLGLVLVFFAISFAFYLLTAALGLPRNISLLITFASGPILGTILMLALFRVIGRRQRFDRPDEPATRDTP